MAKKKWFKVRCTRYAWEEAYIMVQAANEDSAMKGAEKIYGEGKQSIDWKYGGVEDAQSITAWEAREVEL